MVRRIRLTVSEIEALLAAAGNVDPCMFDEMDEPDGDRLAAAWHTGRDKLEAMLNRHRAQNKN